MEIVFVLFYIVGLSQVEDPGTQDIPSLCQFADPGTLSIADISWEVFFLFHYIWGLSQVEVYGLNYVVTRFSLWTAK